MSDRAGLRVLHPLIFRVLLTYAAVDVSLATNFLIFTPTFFIFDQPNRVWATLLLMLGIARVLTMVVLKLLVWVRVTQALGMLLYFLLAAGTLKPLLDGEGSAQLPLLYFWLAGVLSFWFLLEAGVNPRTKK